MLAVATVKIGDPMTFLVLMKCDDPAFHIGRVSMIERHHMMPSSASD